MIKENPLQYSLVLLDMVMPEKTGEQVVHEIYTVTKMYGIPIIIISGYSQTYETKNLLYSMGVVAFIEKPYTYNELRNVINHYLKQTIIPFLILIFLRLHSSFMLAIRVQIGFLKSIYYIPFMFKMI
ncbi:response regulator [Orientia tsutsugamushi]|nr:response regulator [Orientia tsutsugamushi]